METPFSGTAVLLAVAGVLWLVYLVPVWLRRSEYMATERNAARLGQTLRVLAETAEPTEELRTELNAREVAKQHREAERVLRTQSYTPDEIWARRRRILRSTTTLFTGIGLAGLVSSISLQAAFWVTAALAGKTLIGIATLGVLARSSKRVVPVARQQATPQPQRAPHQQTATRVPRLPEPLSSRQAVSAQSTPLPSREQLLKQARAAAAEARPEEAAAEKQRLAPVSQFDQMGRIDRASSETPDIDELLRRRRAV